LFPSVADPTPGGAAPEDIRDPNWRGNTAPGAEKRSQFGEGPVLPGCERAHAEGNVRREALK